MSLSLLSTLAATGQSSGPPQCSFSQPQFFARVDLHLEQTFGGGVNIWNSSIVLAYDGVSQSAHLNSQDTLRSLSSGSYYKVANSERVYVGGVNHIVGTDGTCRMVTVPFIDKPCFGNVAHWLPLTTYQFPPSSKQDAYLTSMPFEGEMVDVFGWNTTCQWGGAVKEEHYVYISQATGMPVFETQAASLACDSYPKRATVRFTIDIDQRGSVGALFRYPSRTGIFKVPTSCIEKPPPAPPPPVASTPPVIPAETISWTWGWTNTFGWGFKWLGSGFGWGNGAPGWGWTSSP